MGPVTFKKVCYWAGWFCLYVLMMLAIGAVLGGILFVTIGAFSHPQLAWSERLRMGASDGAFYFGVWAGGMSIVLCFIRGHRMNAKRRAAENQ